MEMGGDRRELAASQGGQKGLRGDCLPEQGPSVPPSEAAVQA